MKVSTCEPGRVVISRQGHDKGQVFLVIGQADARHVLIADGKSRRPEKPKRKQVKHLIPVPAYSADIADKLKTGSLPESHEIRKALANLTVRGEPTVNSE